MNNSDAEASKKEVNPKIESASKTKQIGMCPFCLKQVAAVVIEENTLRRDKCKCPQCQAIIYTCRTPSCHDYAKGTEVYDHEFCDDCTVSLNTAGRTVASAVVQVGKAVATVAATAAVTAVIAAHSKK
ncbi:MAG: Erwinia phage vB EhrS 59 [Pseudomonadota bacterium]